MQLLTKKYDILMASDCHNPSHYMFFSLLENLGNAIVIFYEANANRKNNICCGSPRRQTFILL